MPNKLFLFHVHSDYSNCTTNIDSVTKVQHYVKAAKDAGMTALAFSEHGNIFNWATKKQLIEAEGMKYVHAIEFYLTQSLTEKVRDNYHLIAMAKNWDGVKEINRLVTASNNRDDGHFYYVPRITLDEFVNTSDNLIFTSACLGGPLHNGADNVKQTILDYFSRNSDRCFLEIQHHAVREQALYNLELVNIGKQYNIRLIAGTDTHSLNELRARARSVVQASRNIKFGNEDGWDLTFKDYDGLVKAYEEQGILDEDVYKEAIANTCIIEDMVDRFEIDTTPKFPKLYDNPQEVLKDKVYKAVDTHPYALKNHSKEEILNRVDKELDVFHKTNMEGFLLFQTYIREWEHKNDIWVGPGRGSVSGSMVAYLLGITEMDSIKFGLNFFRFANPDRQSNPDVDSDYFSPDRDRARNFLLTDKNIVSSEIVSFGTIAFRGAIEYVCKGLGYDLTVTKNLKNSIKVDENKKEYVDESLKNKYPDVFEYVDIVNGTIVSVGTHPAGVLCATRDIGSEIGLVTLSTTPHSVSCLDMYGLDSGWWTKMDMLGLDNVGLINETCKLAGIDRINPDNINLDDWEVWKSIREDNTCIFQYESALAKRVLESLFSDKMISKIRERYGNVPYLKLFSFGNALIRPCGASVREKVANGEFCETGIKDIDDMLAPALGYCIIQEDIMKFAMKFCGYSLNEADALRKGIAKKRGVSQFLDDIRMRFKQVSQPKYNLTDQQCCDIIEPVVQCISDASRYAFSWNHSDAYSFIGYACGWLKHYYPLEFVTTCFNVWNDKEEDTKVVFELAKRLGIKVSPPKFRYSLSDYFMDKETNTVYKGIKSIKYMNNNVGEYLYLLRNEKYDTFFDFLRLIDTKMVDARQLTILIKLDFFSEFGNSRFLMALYEFYQEFGNAKHVSKAKLKSDVLLSIFKRNGRETDKKIVDLDIVNIFKEAEQMFKVVYSTDFSMKEKVSWQKEYVGYVDFRTGKQEDRTRLLVEEISALKRKTDGQVWAYVMKTLSIGSGKKSELVIVENIYKKNPILQFDVIRVSPTCLVKNVYNGRTSWRLKNYNIESGVV